MGRDWDYFDSDSMPLTPVGLSSVAGKDGLLPGLRPGGLIEAACCWISHSRGVYRSIPNGFANTVKQKWTPNFGQ